MVLEKFLRDSSPYLCESFAVAADLLAAHLFCISPATPRPKGRMDQCFYVVYTKF